MRSAPTAHPARSRRARTVSWKRRRHHDHSLHLPSGVCLSGAATETSMGLLPPGRRPLSHHDPLTTLSLLPHRKKGLQQAPCGSGLQSPVHVPLGCGPASGCRSGGLPGLRPSPLGDGTQHVARGRRVLMCLPESIRFYALKKGRKLGFHFFCVTRGERSGVSGAV